jgi:hypothetical protein
MNRFILLVLFTLMEIVYSSNGFSPINALKSLPLHRLYSYIDAQKSALIDGPIDELICNGPIPVKDRIFMINGWRWHTKSVLRDLDRFEKVLHECSNEKNQTVAIVERLKKCYSFVFAFNWGACMRVERELFFPWLQSLLPQSTKYLFTEVYRQHDSIQSMSASLSQECSEISTSVNGYKKAFRLLSSLKESALAIQVVQETIFVPYVAAYVKKKDQEKFNSRVISRLGLLESQIHLVSMKEAITGNKNEEGKFREQIPYIARSLIPIWKKRFYHPKSECLE